MPIAPNKPGPRLAKIVQKETVWKHISAVESFSLCFCNPPYDWALAGNARERLEAVFLNHIFRWLNPGGVLLLVIPAERATDCAQILASHFKRARVFRLSHPESVRYRQVLVAGVRRTRAVSANNFVTARSARCRVIASRRSDGEYETLPELADSCEDPYAVPTSGPAALTFKGLPLDEVEGLVANSPKPSGKPSEFSPRNQPLYGGRPLTPLHAGQVTAWSLALVSSTEFLARAKSATSLGVEEQKGYDETHRGRGGWHDRDPRAGTLCPGAFRRLRDRGNGHA